MYRVGLFVLLADAFFPVTIAFEVCWLCIFRLGSNDVTIPFIVTIFAHFCMHNVQ